MGVYARIRPSARARGGLVGAGEDRDEAAAETRASDADARDDDARGARRGGAWVDDSRVVRVKTTTSANGVTRAFAVDGAFDENATQREVQGDVRAGVGGGRARHARVRDGVRTDGIWEDVFFVMGRR